MTTSVIKLVLGSDHGGFELKEYLETYLKETRGDMIVEDMGTHDESSVDYPDFGQAVAHSVAKKTHDLGILVCGTGIGISMSANRIRGVRAALVYDDFTAKMAKEHNNANIICLGGRTISKEKAKKCVDVWLNATFEGDRHQRRLDKLDHN